MKQAAMLIGGPRLRIGHPQAQLRTPRIARARVASLARNHDTRRAETLRRARHLLGVRKLQRPLGETRLTVGCRTRVGTRPRIGAEVVVIPARAEEQRA